MSQSVVAVQIALKAAASVAARDFSGLDVLREVAGRRFFRGIVLSARPQFRIFA